MKEQRKMKWGCGYLTYEEIIAFISNRNVSFTCLVGVFPWRKIFNIYNDRKAMENKIKRFHYNFNIEDYVNKILYIILY